MVLGVRVVRGSAWNLGNQDGGPNHVGTITGVLADDRVRVQWDMGSSTICRAGQDGPHDLTVFDIAPTGIRHTNVTCDECYETDIRGIRWKCAICDDFDLCTPCYLDDSHKATHAFKRIDHPGASPMQLAKRSISQRQRVMGMFPNAEVVRGPDWNRGDEDDVTKLQPIGNMEESSTQISVGDNVCVDMSTTEFAAIQKRRLVWNDTMEEVIGQILIVNDVTKEGDCLVEYDDRSMVIDKDAVTKVPVHKKRDYVRVIESTERLKRLQQNHGGWTEDMNKVKGRIGKIAVIDSDGDVGVGFGDADYVFHPLCLVPVPSSEGEACATSDTGDIGDLAMGVSDERRTTKQQDSDNDSDDALDLLQGFAGLLLLETLARRNATDVKVDFIKSVIDGKDQDVKTLLQKHPGLKNLEFKEVPCFIIAAIKEHRGVVRVFLDAGVDINMQDPKGNTALMVSVSLENGSIARFLSDNGANLDMTNGNRQTALHIAVRAKFLEGVKILLGNGAGTNIQDIAGDTPLHDAIERQHDMIARLLIQQPGLDVWLKNKKEFTVLVFACFKSHAASVDALISKEPRLVTSLMGRASGGCYPIHIAAINNHLVEAKLLLEKGGADVNAANEALTSPLHLAAEEGFYNMVELLIKSNADYRLKDVKGNTPLHLCLQGRRSGGLFLGLRSEREMNERIKTAECLIEKGANPEAKNWSGETPLEVCSNSRVRSEVEKIVAKRRMATQSQGQQGHEMFSLFSLLRRRCRRCSAGTADTRFIPCNHIVACRGCCHSYKRCPLCNILVLRIVPA